MKKIIMTLLVLIMLVQNGHMAYAQTTSEVQFDDVEVGHWAEPMINELRRLEITDGVGNNHFAPKNNVKRAEFIKFLVMLRKDDWNLVVPLEGSYSDNQDTSIWYYSYIETALANGVIDKTYSEFRPSDNITREEMAIMIVNSLGYNSLALSLEADPSPFTDVSDNVGFMIILSDFGIVNGKGDGLFAPDETATREEAAAILIRMYNKLEATLDEVNAFYAIKSYPQIELVERFDAISFGWAGLKYSEEFSEVVLDYKPPTDYEEPLNRAWSNAKEVRLSVFKSAENGHILEALLGDSDKRTSFVQSLVTFLKSEARFDGIVIDFEDMTSEMKDDFTLLITELDFALTKIDKTLTVMVQPMDYNASYDYKKLGELADNVIMMAHDYNAKSLTSAEQARGYTTTPLAPINDVYNALKVMTDDVIGVEDHDKISIQCSFGVAQWGVDENGYVVNSVPYTPDYDMLNNRLLDEGTTIHFGDFTRNPYATYYNDEDDLDYTIWYEDARSIAEKIKLMKMFGVNDLSIWRIGNIPNYLDPGDKNVYMNVMDVLE